MNADHLAAWRLDAHGNPIGAPHTFGYQLDGTAAHRDAQVRHALTRLLHWAKPNGVTAIAVEDLDFTDSKTREKHGRRRRFRQVISGMPTGRLRARLLAMATEAAISIIAVDPAYTSQWGAQHWQKPLAPPIHEPPGTTPRAWRSDGAPSGTGSGDGRHRPDHTRVMWPGIGPARPDPQPADARKPATPRRDHGHDPCTHPDNRTRATRRPNTVRGRPPSRTYSRSVIRNGVEVAVRVQPHHCKISVAALQAGYRRAGGRAVPRKQQGPRGLGCRVGYCPCAAGSSGRVQGQPRGPGRSSRLRRRGPERPACARRGATV